jgi:16S rRNA (guanine527-N7)-methyltransferase
MNDDVSRETPPVPAAARGVFPSSRLPLIEQYASVLATEGVLRGLIGPREAPRLWDRHLLNCGVLAELLPEDATVCDIGSGAGLPGLVLAIARPDLRVTLVEPLLRRTTFLAEAADRLGLGNVEVQRARADALHGQRSFGVVTSRAVAPLDRLLGWSMPLVAPDGVLLAMKGSSVGDEVADAAPVLRELGCADPEVLVLGADRLETPTYALRVAWADPSHVSWPLASEPSSDRAARRGRSGRSASSAAARTRRSGGGRRSNSKRRRQG